MFFSFNGQKWVFGQNSSAAAFPNMYGSNMSVSLGPTHCTAGQVKLTVTTTQIGINS